MMTQCCMKAPGWWRIKQKLHKFIKKLWIHDLSLDLNCKLNKSEIIHNRLDYVKASTGAIPSLHHTLLFLTVKVMLDKHWLWVLGLFCSTPELISNCCVAFLPLFLYRQHYITHPKTFVLHSTLSLM